MRAVAAIPSRRRSAGPNTQQPIMAGVLVGLVALAIAVSSFSQRPAAAVSEPGSAAAIDAAFAAFRGSPVTNATPVRPAVKDSCSDFSFAFVNSQCRKAWKRHVAARRHVAAVSRSGSARNLVK